MNRPCWFVEMRFYFADERKMSVSLKIRCVIACGDIFAAEFDLEKGLCEFFHKLFINSVAPLLKAN